MSTTSSAMWLDNVIEKEKYGLLLKAILLVLVTSITFFVLLHRKLKCLPPGPRGWPILGYLPLLETDLHKQFARLSETYGPIYSLYLGSRLCVVITSPVLVKEVVRDQDPTFVNRNATVSAKVATFGTEDIAFRDYGPEWKRLRKVFVRDMMGKAILDNLYTLRKVQVKKSARQIYANVGKPVDIGNLAYLTSRNSILSMMLGTSLQDLEDKVSVDAGIQNNTHELMTLLGRANISDFLPSLAWLDLQGVKKDTQRVIHAVEVMLDSVIKQRTNEMLTSKGSAIPRQDYLQTLLEVHQKAETEYSISLTEIKGLLLDNFLGGTDTTSGSVEWVMAELLKNPVTLKKVQEEVERVVGANNEVEESHLSQLTYLDAAFKETLRLHPALPLGGPRCAIESTTLGGYTIPKGTKIFMNMWAIQRDPSIWENPLEFKPERFLDSASAAKYDYAGNNFTYLPFGSGRRVCPGISLADRLSKYIIATFVHLFEWRLPEGANMKLEDRYGIVVKIKDPIFGIPTPRFSNSELYI